MTLEDWLKVGYKNGWCGPAICYTHDGLPMSDAEFEEFEENDPCLHIVRLYESSEQKQAVEESHSPSVWRAANLEN